MARSRTVGSGTVVTPGTTDRIASPAALPVRQHDARNRPVVVEPEELVDRVRAPRRAPPPLQIGGLPEPRLRIRQASALQQLRHQREVLETRRPHLADRRAHSRSSSRTTSRHTPSSRPIRSRTPTSRKPSERCSAQARPRSPGRRPPGASRARPRGRSRRARPAARARRRCPRADASDVDAQVGHACVDRAARDGRQRGPARRPRRRCAQPAGAPAGGPRPRRSIPAPRSRRSPGGLRSPRGRSRATAGQSSSRSGSIRRVIHPVRLRSGDVPLGDVRLLRHADRLERRHPRRAGGLLRRRACAGAARPLPRARARGAGRDLSQLRRGADDHARAPGRPRRGCRSRKARPARSPARCPTGRAFPEVPRALAELRERGWNLAILSNTDHALITASQKTLGVPFDIVVTAEDVGSYKPAHGHWERFFELTTADRAAPRPRRREPLPRRRARARARAEDRLDQPARRGRRPRARPRAAGSRRRCPTRSRSSSHDRRAAASRRRRTPSRSPSF